MSGEILANVLLAKELGERLQETLLEDSFTTEQLIWACSYLISMSILAVCHEENVEPTLKTAKSACDEFVKITMNFFDQEFSDE